MLNNSILIPHILIIKEESFKNGSLAVGTNSVILVSNDASSVYLCWTGEILDSSPVCAISKENKRNIWQGFDKLNLWLNHGKEIDQSTCNGNWYLELPKCGSEFNGKCISLKNVRKTACTHLPPQDKSPNLELFFKIETEPNIHDSSEKIDFINNILENAPTFHEEPHINIYSMFMTNIIDCFGALEEQDSVVDISIQKPNILTIENDFTLITLKGHSSNYLNQDKITTTINISKIKEFISYIRNKNSKSIRFIISEHNMPLILKSDNNDLLLIAPIYKDSHRDLSRPDLPEGPGVGVGVTGEDSNPDETPEGPGVGVGVTGEDSNPDETPEGPGVGVITTSRSVSGEGVITGEGFVLTFESGSGVTTSDCEETRY